LTPPSDVAINDCNALSLVFRFLCATMTISRPGANHRQHGRFDALRKYGAGGVCAGRCRVKLRRHKQTHGQLKRRNFTVDSTIRTIASSARYREPITACATGILNLKAPAYQPKTLIESHSLS
jgi:hypothetical protein